MVMLCEIQERPFIALAIDAADACNGGLCQARLLEGVCLLYTSDAADE